VRSANILEILWFRRTEREKYDGTKSVFNLCALFAKYLMLKSLAGVRQNAASNLGGWQGMLDKDEPKECGTTIIEGNVHAIPEEPLVRALRSVIRTAVRVLAILMTLVIIWGVLDVLAILVASVFKPPYLRLQISDILATFGAFMAVLTAIEIFVNITVYLREDVIHVKTVMATALMAIARKVIILEVKDEDTTPLVIFSIAALVLAMSIGYYLAVVRAGDRDVRDTPREPSPK